MRLALSLSTSNHCQVPLKPEKRSLYLVAGYRIYLEG